MNVQEQIEISDRDVPATIGLVSLVHMVQAADRLFMNECIVARSFAKQPPMERFARCRVMVLAQYSDLFEQAGLTVNDHALQVMLECPIPSEVDLTQPVELPARWVFNGHRGWRRKSGTN